MSEERMNPDRGDRADGVEVPEPRDQEQEVTPGSADALPGGALSALEAILMVIDAPASETDLSISLGIPVDRVRSMLVELAAEYRGAGGLRPRGFELRELAGGWRIYSHPDYAPVVERFVREGQTARLTQASLETLAIVAYRQPVSRGRISAIRGVNGDSVLRTLVARGLVDQIDQDAESGAMLYGTTPYFLERMGMGSLDELEALAPHLPDGAELEEIKEQVEA